MDNLALLDMTTLAFGHCVPLGTKGGHAYMPGNPRVSVLQLLLTFQIFPPMVAMYTTDVIYNTGSELM